MGFGASRTGAVLGFLLCYAAPVAAEADEPAVDSSDASERLVGRPVFEGQAAAFVSHGDECTASSDLVGCSGPVLFLGGQLGGFYTAAPWVSVGGVGAFLLRPGVMGTSSSDGSSTEVRTQLWRLGGQGRFHPFASEMLMPWAGLEIGFATVRTTIDRNGFASGENGRSANSRSTATFALGLGLDAWLAEQAAIVGQVWLTHVGLDRDEAQLPADDQPFYTSPWWYALGLGARVRL